MAVLVLLIVLVACTVEHSLGVGVSVHNVMYDIEGTGVGDYKLAFRAAAGIGKSVYEAYRGNGNSPKVSKASCCKQMTSTHLCVNHYRNDAILDNWNNVEKVALALYKNGVKVKYLIFNGDGSTNTDWFSPNRLLNSSWTDLATSSHNHFSMEGLYDRGRRFYINNDYGRNCVHDYGWLFVSEKVRGLKCAYEEEDQPWPRFVYARGDSKATWYMSDERETADVLAVFVKEYSSYTCILE